MFKTLFRMGATFATVACICSYTVPASADGIDNVYEKAVVPNANEAIRNVMDAEQQKRDAQRRQAGAASPAPATSVLPNGTVAQVPPVGQPRPGRIRPFRTGFEFFVDVTTAYPYGNIGSYGRQGWLMGGVDGSVTYAISPTTRVAVSMFQLQHWPYGFNSGLAPVYLAGFRNPVGCADLSGGNACGPGAGQNINVRTKDTFGIFMLSQVFLMGGMPGHHYLPIVVSPTYVTRGGQIGESPNNTDVVPFAHSVPDGPVYTNVATRTAQFKSVAITLPFLKTPKMFGTFTVAPEWLMHTAGVNGSNHMQLPQILYVEYSPFRGTRLFFEPQSARDYLPTDPYPEHLMAYFLGVSQRISKYGFAQLVLNGGGPTNLGPDQVLAIKCLNVQICGPIVGGLKATQLQLQIGIGSPGYFPL
ncbi:MAG: hypothetical protein WB615_13990 [Candidatus Tumulicola sp.]